MSCSILSTGRNLPCTKGVGGIKSIILVDYGLLGDLSITGAEVTAISTTPTGYEYLVKPGSSGLEQTITASAENGTVYYDQNVNVQFQKLDKETQGKENLQLLLHNSLIEDKLFLKKQSLTNLTLELDNYKYSILNKAYSILKSKSQILGNIKTITIKPKTQSIILLGIVLGFFTSILLVFIRNFVKSYKESQA